MSKVGTATKMNLQSCTVIYRLSKSGEPIYINQCRVDGSNAKLIFVNGFFAGLTGSPTKADLDTFRTWAGSSASDMLSKWSNKIMTEGISI